MLDCVIGRIEMNSVFVVRFDFLDEKVTNKMQLRNIR
jgi:hypothetical protein